MNKLKLELTSQHILSNIRSYCAGLLALVASMGLQPYSNLPKHFSPPLLWQVSFLSVFPFKEIFLISILFVLFFCLCTILLPGSAFWRRALFVALFCFEGLNSSIGGRTHLFQFWLWSCFFLALMPDIKKIPSPRKQFLNLVYGWYSVIIIILIFYGLAGFWKLIGFFQQFFLGEPQIFSPKGLLYHIASEKIRSGANPMAFELLAQHLWLNPLLELAAVTLQCSCFLAIFFCGSQRFIGLLLIIFHLATYFILSITYPTNLLLVGLTICNSPFKKTIPWRTTLKYLKP